MGCHTWTYKNKTAHKKQDFHTTQHPFLFRVFDYQEDILTSYEEAEKFILNTFEKSTNIKPKKQSKKRDTILTYTGQMKGKILFASEDGSENLTDPSLTLERVKNFFSNYPKGIIEFG